MRWILGALAVFAVIGAACTAGGDLDEPPATPPASPNDRAAHAEPKE
jgi:hypothetical protein